MSTNQWHQAPAAHEHSKGKSDSRREVRVPCVFEDDVVSVHEYANQPTSKATAAEVKKCPASQYKICSKAYFSHPYIH